MISPFILKTSLDEGKVKTMNYRYNVVSVLYFILHMGFITIDESMAKGTMKNNQYLCIQLDLKMLCFSCIVIFRNLSTG